MKKATLLNILFLILGFGYMIFYYSANIVVHLNYPTRNSYWMEKLFQIKDAYANSIEEQKIIFIAGSNILWGLKTNLIEDYYNIPTVNMGIHASLQISYMLDRVKK